MRIEAVIPSRVWVHTKTGQQASIYGAAPGPGWEMREIGWTWRWDDGRVGIPTRRPAKTKAEAERVMREINEKFGGRRRNPPPKWPDSSPTNEDLASALFYIETEFVGEDQSGEMWAEALALGRDRSREPNFDLVVDAIRREVRPQLTEKEWTNIGARASYIANDQSLKDWGVRSFSGPVHRNPVGRKNPVELETTGYMRGDDLKGRGGPWTTRYEIKDRPQDWGGYDVPVHVIEHATGSDYSGGLVTRSNYNVIQEMVEENDDLKRFVIYFYGGHGTYGVAIRLDYGEVPDDLLEVVGALANYPLLDEEAHSTLEMEAEDEAWDSFGREEWRDALKAEFPDQEDELDDMPDEKLDELWHDASRAIGWHAQHEGGGGVVFNFDDAVSEVSFED